MPLQTKSLRSSFYRPTTSLSGNETPSVFRGKNLVLRGAIDNPYFEVFPGNKDLGENYDLSGFALTGTLSFTADSNTVSGSATVFRDELHLGQHILAGTQVLQVKQIVSDESFICDRAPDTTEPGVTGYRMPQLFEINGKRGVMLSGNAIELGKGHKIAVGSGELHINGAVLAGDSLEASNRAKAAIYQPTTDDYIIQELGFEDAPPLPSIEMIGDGVKGMVDYNKHSFRFSYWTGSPEGTDGYSNASEVLKLDSADQPIQIDPAGPYNKFRVNFTDSLVGMPANAKGFVIWGSLAGQLSHSVTGADFTATSPNEGNYNNGPWYRVAKVLTEDLATNTYEFEYLDSDVYEEVTGGNDKPPGSEFVAIVDGRPMYISCYGAATTAEGEGSNPGPFCSLSKYANPDAAPAEWAIPTVSGSSILGWFEAVGRWFLLTPGSLEFIVATGLYGQQSQGGNQVELPIIARPYWKTGASNRYSVIMVDETLYGRSGGKFFRSVASGDENVKKYDFGGVVEDITQGWSDGYVLVANDPKNTQILFFHTAAYKNASGYWVTEILPYSLFNDAWLPTIVLSSESRDMIVSGVATVDEKLEFLCGGRVSGGTFQSKTYRYAANETAEDVPWYLIWQISDDGMENQSKQVHSIRPSGKFTSMAVQIHGAKPGQPVSVENMENGTGTAEPTAYFSGSMAFDDSSLPTRYLPRMVKIRNLGVYAVRIAGTWDGLGIKDRLEEVVLEVSTHGRPR